MRVFLIHGMGRTPMSMMILKRRLEGAGHRVTLFGYLVTTQELDAIADRFVERVQTTMAEDTAQGEGDWAVVGHSLGNIVTRRAFPRLPASFRRFVMLAPPNRPPAIARALERNWIFRALTRDAGDKLTDPEFYDRLPVPDVPSLIIAGTRGPRLRWLPFHGQPNDCLVTVEETRLGEVPVLEVHAAHSFMMNRRDVFETIVAFFDAEGGDPAARVVARRDSGAAQSA